MSSLLLANTRQGLSYRPLVLKALTRDPYEPVADALFLKTTFLLAPCSAERVKELCALSLLAMIIYGRGQMGQGYSFGLTHNPFMKSP